MPLSFPSDSGGSKGSYDMPQQSVASQYRQEAARLRREAEMVASALFGVQLIAVACRLENMAAVSDERAAGIF